MSEQGDQQKDWRDDPYLRALENDKKLAAWQQQKKAEAEAKDRQKKQGELQAYLERRSKDWREVTGSEPSPDEVRRWQREYLEQLELERELERASNIDTSHLPG